MKPLFSILVLLFLVSITSCVQETYLKTVTVKLDMNGVSTTENVGVKGNFTNPSWKQVIPLTDDDHDGIFEATLSQKTAVNAIQFKFVNQGQYELKDQPNRTLEFKYKPETITYEAIFDVPKATITVQ
ncbi:hypothetical protein [uncultured Kordia sp.]|uniref:hypothetical protein n=1 Tax=uncultured Kordia sp. TaxID=507699 RepID=UPI00260850F8|nr:hypothetical protein [uncultured Kordia sp.]